MAGLSEPELLALYETAWNTWLAGVRRRKRAVREGKLSERVAAKRNQVDREAMTAFHDQLEQVRLQTMLASLSFRKGEPWKKPPLKGYRSLWMISV